MIKKRLYKFLISILLIIFSINANAQLLDSIAIDTVPTYTLERALKQDPLKVYKLNLKKMKLLVQKLQSTVVLWRFTLKK